MLPTRVLGQTGLRVSVLALGAGPVAGLFTADPSPAVRQRQRELLEAAAQAGVDWIDTAPGYGRGLSEAAVGEQLAGSPTLREQFRLATKVRLQPADLLNPAPAIEESIRASLQRLRVPRVTLLQLHNALTLEEGQIPDSVSVDAVLRPGGIAEGLARVRDRGWAEWIGLTGLGETVAVEQVIESGRFATLQLPVNALLLSDPGLADPRVGELSLERVLPACARHGLGVFAIRVFAGGALAGAEPSSHTLQTRYFPLPIFERDRAAAERLQATVRCGMSPAEWAIPPVLDRPEVTSALIGFAAPTEVQAGVRGVGRSG